MTISIAITAESQEELQAAIAALSPLATGAAPAEAKPTTNRKPGRPKAEAKPKEPEKPALKVVAEAEPEAETPAKEDPETTIDDVRTAMSRVIATLGDDGPKQVMEILKVFDVERVSMLPAEHYAEYIERADAVVAKASAS